MNQIRFSTLIHGFQPLTSCPFSVDNHWEAGMRSGGAYVVSLSPYYKRGGQSLYANIYPLDTKKAAKAIDLMAKCGAKIKFYRLRNGRVGSDISFGSANADEIRAIRDGIMDAEVYDGSRYEVIRDMQFESLLAWAQPVAMEAYLRSLPAPIYRSMGMRWTGKDAATAPSKIDEVVDAIIDTQPVPPCQCHPGWSASYSQDLRHWAGYLGYINHPTKGTVNVTPSAPAPAPAPAPASAPATASTLPPMPSNGDSITAQIDALTRRADAAGELATRVDDLIKQIEELKNRPQVVISTTPQFTSSGNVKIGNGEAPHFGLVAVGDWTIPSINPAYSLEGWTASFRCGDLSATFSLADAVNALLRGTPTRLIGPPATGKTSGIVQACAHMGVPCRVIQCGKGLTEYTLLGEQTIDNGSVVWKDGILPALCRNVNADGPAIIVFDEVDHLTASIQSLLHGVLEGRMLDLPNGEKVEIPGNVICVATANTYGTGDTTGRHASANVSDDAFISRWVRTYTVEYLPEKHERDLLMSYGIPSNLIDGLMQFVTGTREQARKIDAGELSDGVRTPVTLRTLIPLAQDCASGADFKKSFLTTVMGQFSPDEMAKARELVRSCLNF